MICPHCSQNSINFLKLYLWPFGSKACPLCKGSYKVKAKPWQFMVSFVLGILAMMPLVFFDNIWYLIPSILITFFIDIVMDIKYMMLQSC